MRRSSTDSRASVSTCPPTGRAVSAFAGGPYAAALEKGAAISDAEKQSVAAQMSKLTGLSTDYILRSNLRVQPNRFQRELLRDRHQIIGRIDSRFVGTESDAAGEAPFFVEDLAFGSVVLPITLNVGFATTSRAGSDQDICWAPVGSE